MPPQQYAVRGKNMTHFLPSPPSTAILISTIDLPWHHLQWVISKPQSVKAAAHSVVRSLMHTHTHTNTLKHTDNHSLFFPTNSCRHTHTQSCASMHVHTHMPRHTLVGIIALTRPNCPRFICMSTATHILHDSPFDKEGSFPQHGKWSPVDIVWLDFAFSRFQDHYRNSFEVLLKMKPRPLFSRLIILIPLFFFALILSLSFFFFFLVCPQSVPFGEIKIIRL